MFSITSDASFAVFADVIYLPLFDSNVVGTSRDKVSVIYIGIDPAYGGMCEFAIVAMAYCPDSRYKYQVCIQMFKKKKKDFFCVCLLSPLFHFFIL